MKKISTFIMLLLLCTFSLAANFRGANWGDSFEEVKKQEKNIKFTQKTITEKKVVVGKSYEWEKEVYSFKEDIKYMGEFNVSYIFLKDRLISGEYSQNLKNGDLKNFNMLKEILTDKYGAANNTSENSSYINKNGRVRSNYTKNYSWNLKDTFINLNLINNEKLELRYTTKDQKLLELIEKNGLKKQSAKKNKKKKKNKHLMKKF